MFLNIYDAETKEIEERARKYLRYELILNNYFSILICLFLTFTIAGNLIVGAIGFLKAEQWSVVVAVLLTGLVSYLVLSYVNRKKMEFYVETDEWTLYYSAHICDRLEKLSKTESHGMKKKLKKEIIKDTKELIYCVRERWDIGNLKAIKELVGDSVSDFRKNLQYRVLPAMRSSDEGILGETSQIMYNLFASSKNLKIDDIRALNQRMNVLPNMEPLHAGKLASVQMIFRKHIILRHSLTILSFLVASGIIGYVMWLLKVPIEYCWVGPIALFVGLTQIYFSRQPKKEQ